MNIPIAEVSWSPIVKTCVISSTPKTLVAVWAGPIFFDLLVFFLTLYNAFARPRDTHSAVTKALYRDGLVLCVRFLWLPSFLLMKSALLFFLF